MELHKIDTNGTIKYVLLDKHMRLVQSVNRYLEYLHVCGRAENTIKAYGHDLKAFFEFLECRGLSYRDINVHIMRDYVEHLRSTNRDIPELYVTSARTGSTINRMIGTAYHFYCHLSAIDDTDNPIPESLSLNIEGVFKNMLYHTRTSTRTRKSIFRVKESAYQTHLLDKKDIRLMYGALNTDRDKLLLKFLLQSGARISEALSLRIEDIPVPDPTDPVTILRNIKSKGKRRDLYIPTDLAVELDKYILENRMMVETDHDYLFTTQHPHFNNKQITYRGIYEVFKRAADNIGIEFKFHDTRHTYVTNLVESGMDISIVRILAGHAHVSTTQRYVKLNSEFIANNLAEYWKSVLPKEEGTYE